MLYCGTANVSVYSLPGILNVDLASQTFSELVCCISNFIVQF